MDDLRRAVRRRYDAEVKAKLVDPALSDVESYQNMRSMLDGQDNSVRGNLAEYWYRARHAPDAKAHVGYEVTRTGGTNQGAKEKRVADMQQGRQVIEVKDVEGTIDAEQFGATVDLLKDDKMREAMGIDQMKYVFTKPEGAMKNLEFLADAYGKHDLDGKLTIEVFDAAGTKHVATDSTSADALLKTLRGEN